MKDSEVKKLVHHCNLKHVAVIMDGNRRWAKQKMLPSAFGHKKGVDALKKTVIACDDFGIKYLTVYAFSTENWNRKPDEVNFLLDLLANTLKNETDDLHKNNVVIRFIGNIQALPSNLQKILKSSENKTKNNSGVNLQIAFNYGARAEITNAVKNIARLLKDNKLCVDEITEEVISKNLYTSDIPDPDLLIRTGGEMRISNYLLWQIAYSEILIIDDFWPDFNKEKFEQALIEFNNRNRRFGE